MDERQISKTMASEGLAPIVKSVSVSLPVEAAFRLFTEGIERWWPLKTHSVGGEEAVTCKLEGWVGGRFYEVNRDGREAEWGRLQAWEPPHRLVSTFYPGRTPEYATEVEIQFQAEGNGTRVTLTHRGWEGCASLLGEAAQAERQGYEGGWNLVLGRYVQQAG